MNNLEGFNFEEQGGDKALALRNALQIELAQKHGDDLEKWVENYAGKFSEIFNPGLIEGLEENYEETIEEIQKKLYH